MRVVDSHRGTGSAGPTGITHPDAPGAAHYNRQDRKNVTALAVPAGLCATCVHARAIESSRGATFIRCELSFTDARFPRYPALPVVACVGYRPKEDPGPGDTSRP